MKRADLPTQKLKLNKERIRALTTTELAVIAGGQGCAATITEHSKLAAGQTTVTGCA